MTTLKQALKRKFKTPEEAVRALGLDESLLSAGVVVGDSKRKEKFPMNNTLSRKATLAHGALAVYLAPKIAMDATIDLTPVLRGITQTNFASKRDHLVRGIKRLVKGKLAEDAKLDDIDDAMDAIEEIEAKDAEPEMKKEKGEDKKARDKAARDKACADKRAAFLKDKLSGDDMEAYDAFGKEDDDDGEETESEAMDAEDPDKEMEEPDREGETSKEDEPAKDKFPVKAKDKGGFVSKSAMDAQIKLATDAAIKRERAIGAAIEEVRPLVGKLTMSFDSADGVFKQVLKMKGVKTDGVHPSAYRAMVQMLPKSGSPALIAQDSASTGDFEKRFPGARIASSI